MACYIQGYTFYLFLFSRKWKHPTLNQYLNVFLMESIKLLFFFLFLFHRLQNSTVLLLPAIRQLLFHRLQNSTALLLNTIRQLSFYRLHNNTVVLLPAIRQLLFHRLQNSTVLLLPAIRQLLFYRLPHHLLIDTLDIH